MAGYARKERSFLQHMQGAGTQSGCAQRAASHKCGGCERERERERRAQAIAHRSHTPRCAMWACRPKFAQVCLRRNVPHFGQRAVDAKSGGELLDARHVPAEVSEMISG